MNSTEFDRYMLAHPDSFFGNETFDFNLRSDKPVEISNAEADRTTRPETPAEPIGNANPKYRVSIEQRSDIEFKSSTKEHTFPRHETARRFYKQSVLSLYKDSSLQAYRICMNSIDDDPWEKPIFRDGMDEHILK